MLALTADEALTLKRVGDHTLYHGCSMNVLPLTVDSCMAEVKALGVAIAIG